MLEFQSKGNRPPPSTQFCCSERRNPPPNGNQPPLNGGALTSRMLCRGHPTRSSAAFDVQYFQNQVHTKYGSLGRHSMGPRLRLLLGDQNASSRSSYRYAHVSHVHRTGAPCWRTHPSARLSHGSHWHDAGGARRGYGHLCRPTRCHRQRLPHSPRGLSASRPARRHDSAWRPHCAWMPNGHHWRCGNGRGGRSAGRGHGQGGRTGGSLLPALPLVFLSSVSVLYALPRKPWKRRLKESWVPVKM